MTTFQLYKKRDFSSYIGDSMNFLKVYGKNFLRNYIIINGGLLLLLIVLYYFTFKDIFANMYNEEALSTWINYQDNIVMFIVMMLLFFVVTLLFAVTSVAYPIAYIRLVDKTDKDTFTASEVFAEVKSYFGQILIFGFISVFVMTPLLLIFNMVVAVFGIILLELPLVASIILSMAWSLQALYVYLSEEVGYFAALGRAWKIIFGNFWHILGSSVAVYILILVINSVVSIVPTITMLGSYISTGANPSQMIMPSYMVIINVISMILTYILMNIFYVHQAMVYYGSLEERENVNSLSEIDSIGQNEE